MQEAARAGGQVEPVSDQDVVGGVADPGEVLELIGGQQPVGARQGAALDQQPGQHHQRQRAEGDQRAGLDGVEAQRSQGRLQAAGSGRERGGGGAHARTVEIGSAPLIRRGPGAGRGCARGDRRRGGHRPGRRLL